ncbi:MAG: hypothetical protein K2M30_00750, partial [Desulfovibrionaceae bacterium]|nr:hypothetical protein [Desulfovibrionaceae bacterium]
MFSTIREKVVSLFKGKRYREKKYISPMVRDIEYAISELNKVVHNDSEPVELYIALASLYRVHGDVEKALQIHARLLVRSDITHGIKSRLYAELGKDYRRLGILDRAIASYIQAKEYGYVNEDISYE